MIKFYLCIFILLSSNPGFAQSFNPEAIDKWAEHVRQKIRTQTEKDKLILLEGEEIRQHNLEARARGGKQRLLPPEYDAAEERLSLKKLAEQDHSIQCLGDAFITRLKESVRDDCGIRIVRQICAPNFKIAEGYRLGSDSIFQEFKRNIIENKKGLVNEMKNYKTKLIGEVKDLQEKNIRCSTAFQQHVLQPKCFSSYNRIFEDRIVDLAANSCSEEQFEFQITKFKSDMVGSRKEGEADKLHTTGARHIKSRDHETAITYTLVKIDELIQQLEAGDQILLASPRPKNRPTEPSKRGVSNNGSQMAEIGNRTPQSIPASFKPPQKVKPSNPTQEL